MKLQLVLSTPFFQDKIGVGKGAKDQRVDEIKDFVNASWYGDTNSCWRLFEFPLNQMSPAVTKLALHLPNQQFVTYNPERVETEEDLRNVMEAQERTTLTAFFELNREDPEANQYTYPEILRYYRWVANEGGKKKFFQKRKKRQGAGEDLSAGESTMLGRIPVIVPTGNPKREELFHLRLLLHHVPGPKSFEDLKRVTVNGETKEFETFQLACVERGLVEGDSGARDALREACLMQTGRNLRVFFVNMVAYGMVADPKALYEEFRDELSEHHDERPVNFVTTPRMINKALLEMKDLFDELNGQKLSDHGLPEPDMQHIPQPQVEREWQEEIDRRQAAEDSEPERNVDQMNSDQKAVFNEIIKSVEQKQGRLFAIDAPGGTGKTFLLTTLLDTVRKGGRIAVATAFTGIAAILLPGGRTLHSKLKVPFGEHLHEEAHCGFTSKKSGTRKLLCNTDLLIIDEVTMTERMIFQAVDRTLRLIRGPDDKTPHKQPFGGLTVVISGDWRQTLPVIPRATRDHIVSETLKGKSNKVSIIVSFNTI